MSEVCGFALRCDLLCSFSVSCIPTVRVFIHFCAVFRFLPNFRTVFTEISSGFSVPGTPLTPPIKKLRYDLHVHSEFSLISGECF